MGIDTLNAKVSQKIDVTPDLMILRVTPDGWELPSFLPGQYTVLGLRGSHARCPQSDPEPEAQNPDKLVRRAYSIASSSLEKEFLEFYITLVRSGALTPRLFALGVGDGVFLGGKITGIFTLNDVPVDKHVVFVATGTGLAPYMSMIRTYLEAGGPRHFAVLHGAYHSWDLGYRTELFTLQRLCRNFAYLPIISEPKDEPVPWKGPAGFVQDLWTGGALEAAWGFHPKPEDTHVFICGNPNMIEAVTGLLKGEGFLEHSRQSPGQIHVEKYW